MTPRLVAALAVSFGLALAGCQSTPQAVQQKEDLLSAAGFVPQPANTPQRIAAMKKLPPNRFVQQAKNSQIVYVYTDPVVCQCVYFGNQAAYAQFRQMVFQQNLADERQMTAAMNQDAFDFGPWGGSGPFMY
jgi:hypothetical protein